MPSAPLHYRLTWPVGIPTAFQTPVSVPLHSPNGRHLPAQGDCERFYHNQWRPSSATQKCGTRDELAIYGHLAWWWHQMETFSALLAICAGNSPVPGEFTAQRPVTRSFDVFFDLRLNKRLSKQSRDWWFETPASSLWRHRNGVKSDSCTAHQILYSFHFETRAQVLVHLQ